MICHTDFNKIKKNIEMNKIRLKSIKVWYNKLDYFEFGTELRKKRCGMQKKVGIGFTTGRRNFQQVLKTYVYNWRESGLTNILNISLNLFIAYDLTYSNTKIADYTNVGKDILKLVDDFCFIGAEETINEKAELISKGILNEEEAKSFFGKGYAARRNAILYMAIKNKVDYLIFFDDDEYPMAVTKTGETAVWGGQHVLATHLKNIEKHDITNGFHCGYISPIPYLEFNEVLPEKDFEIFIGAISNDIVNWNTIRSVMNNGGVTYADTSILVRNNNEEIMEINHAKFISGANLCINLTKPSRVFPFYNPPGARGEDTFLSTCLKDRKVMRVPCYCFHDGFSTYHSLMDGVLPIKLKYIKADSPEIIERFYNACIGWIRYKPLFLYVTQQNDYDSKINEIRVALVQTLPQVCLYFGEDKFMNILSELEKYNKKVKKHYESFIETKRIWAKISSFFRGRK